MSPGRDASTGHMAEIYVLAEIRTKTRTEGKSLPMSSTCWRSQVLLQRSLSLRQSAHVGGLRVCRGHVCAVCDRCTRDNEHQDECSWGRGSGSAIKYASEAEVPCQLERGRRVQRG